MKEAARRLEELVKTWIYWETSDKIFKNPTWEKRSIDTVNASLLEIYLK